MEEKVVILISVIIGYLWGVYSGLAFPDLKIKTPRGKLFHTSKKPT